MPESSSKTDRQAGEPACEALAGRQRQREGNSEGRASPQPRSGPTRVSVPRGGSPETPQSRASNSTRAEAPERKREQRQR